MLHSAAVETVRTTSPERRKINHRRRRRRLTLLYTCTRRFRGFIAVLYYPVRSPRGGLRKSDRRLLFSPASSVTIVRTRYGSAGYAIISSVAVVGETAAAAATGFRQRSECTSPEETRAASGSRGRSVDRFFYLLLSFFFFLALSFTTHVYPPGVLTARPSVRPSAGIPDKIIIA